MGARPITGWSYAPRGPGSPWLALHGAFGHGLASDPAIARALDAARHRWGSSRLGFLTATDRWSAEQHAVGRGFGYATLGLRASADLLGSAWGLLDEDVVDAVLLRGSSAEVLLERAGSATLQLRPEAVDGVDLVLRPKGGDCLAAIAVASASIDGGIPCGEGGSEPDRAHVYMPEQLWAVEVRG